MSEHVVPKLGYEPQHPFEIPHSQAGQCGHIVGFELGWPIYCQLRRDQHPVPAPRVHIPLEPEDGP